METPLDTQVRGGRIAPIGVVLAAGKGTRMGSDLPKVAHEAAGKPLVVWVVDALRDAGVADCVVVVTDHTGVDYAAVLDAAPLIVDTRNALKRFQSPKIVTL